MSGATVTRTADDRVERVQGLAADRGLDALVATSDASIEYLSGLRTLQFERLFAVVVREDGGSLLVPAIDEETASAAPSALERVAYPAASDGLAELIAALDGARTVGVEENHLWAGRAWALERAGVRLEPAGAAVMELRQAKDAGEVARIRAACHVVEDVLERMFRELRPGASERATNAKVEHWLKERGATDAHPLVLFGENAASPHGEPGERVLAAGDVVCADVSARLDGYWGDLTRCGTVGPSGNWARQSWEVVREAQAAAIAAARAQAPAHDVDRAQRTIVEGASALGRCLHGAGHAIGLEVHEPPYLVPGSPARLADGMVLTIEPGIYRQGVGGIRLEDDVLVTGGEPELLSELPLELWEIPA